MKKGRNSPDKVNGDRSSQQSDRSPYYNFPQHSPPDQEASYHPLDPVTIGVPQEQEYSSLNTSKNNRASSADVYVEVH